MQSLHALLSSAGLEREVFLCPGSRKYGRHFVKGNDERVSRKIICVKTTNKRNGSAIITLCSDEYGIEATVNGETKMVHSEMAPDAVTGKMQLDRAKIVLYIGDSIRLAEVCEKKGADKVWHRLPDTCSFTLRMIGLCDCDEESREESLKRVHTEFADFIDDSEDVSTAEDRRNIKKLARCVVRMAPKPEMLNELEKIIPDIDVAQDQCDPVLKVIAKTSIGHVATLNTDIEQSIKILSPALRQEADALRAMPEVPLVEAKSKAVEKRRQLLMRFFKK